ncbi:PP2C family protein-serine/threonine phosphatase [Nonomuraea angiospora]|uniref:Serine phosphatase RsbU (Regulator of sigma subunit) n=1 Tax=Nonomuraea angiospora TaxID=46172 RepID=A0ABR9M3X6_9ACTN|nr:fused response regulator/phosphatase [Nonomuraea angiospora]MBE1587615.1 serine phosphatase RsbU (regulator of sigma subunit) [Nonomuraea angiospora]MDX3103321.1 fused response regulator/phosphatase [Nonomuraea angiospora]
MTAHLSETLTLLLIEDDDGDAFLVEELLKQALAPPKVFWARSLQEARAKLTPQIQCVLVDLSLPDASGLEALEEVLALAPHTAVLVLTGLRDAHVGVAAVQAGAQDYLVKSDVDERLLARAIRYSMERKRADLAHVSLVQAELTAKENSRLQNALLPGALLRTGAIEHVTRYLPGSGGTLAGDFFDTVQTPDGSVHIVVGDVCGHGPDEAALGVALRIAWRTLVLAGQTDDTLLRTLDAVLRAERNTPEIFTTLCMATIAPDLRHARMRVVGHPPPVLVRDGVVQVVDEAPSGPPLGIFSDAEWSVIDVPLGDEWSMMLYTDGLIEAAVGEGRELLGVEGLIDLVREHGAIDLDRLITHVGTLSDDLAVVLVRRRRA